MQTNLEHYGVTPVTLENFNQRIFEITFEVYNQVQNCKDELVYDYLHTIGNEEFYESLKYHSDIIYSALFTNNLKILDEYIVWKYSYCFTRKIEADYFLIEYNLWKQSIIKYLYPSHSYEINILYDYLIDNHANFKLKASSLKNIVVDFKYEELFEELLSSLLNTQKITFYNLVEKNLSLFNNNIFIFIKEIIDPLMYKIGQMWQLNEITVAKEHLVTSFIDEMINDFIKKDLIDEINRPIALVTTISDESHILPIKILTNYLLTKNYEVRNISSKLANKELINFIYDLKPDIIFLSVTLPSNISNLKKVLEKLKEDKLFTGKIIVGGQALFINDKRIQIEGADFIAKNLDELENYLEFKQ